MKLSNLAQVRLAGVSLGLTLIGCPLWAHAADVVVASNGGLWEVATRECFVAPYEKQTGKRARVVLGSSPQWVNQVAANPNRPPIDLIIVPPDMVIDNIKRGLVEPFTPDKLPVLEEMDPRMLEIGRGHAAVVGYSSMGLAYNTETVKNPPKTWEEFVARTQNGEWNAAIQGMKEASTPSTVLWMFAHVFGGGADNIDPAFQAIERMNAKGHMRVWNDMNEFLNLLKLGEIDIGMYWEGRTWAFHDDGNPEIAFIKPEPGVAIHSSLVQKVKNGNPDAWDFLNVMLSAEAMSCFGNRMQYGVGNGKAVYKPDVIDRVTKPDEILWPPYEEIAVNVRDWVEQWNREVAQ
ncbi:extracellular solute-binding protein [Verticiella sediminum]|uniref:Extracellular solute-binding protein n=1 Tax=Verticiella sediminum TaxID=1247510 RepID=A0A556ACD9_9BURK|nr:extracellular solute-binding protein [Verticiella sediminum]TSH90556.1 extracellular solute-binding protein [Verticiella sediminum]